MFDDQQPVTQRQTIYTSLGPRNRVKPLRPVRCDAFVLDCMIELMYTGGACLSLYRLEGRAIVLVLVGYNWRVLVLLQRLLSLNVRLGQFLNTWRSRHLVLCLQANLGPAQETSK